MNLLHSNVQYIKSNRSPDLVFSFLSSPLPSLFPSLLPFCPLSSFASSHFPSFYFVSLLFLLLLYFPIFSSLPLLLTFFFAFALFYCFSGLFLLFHLSFPLCHLTFIPSSFLFHSLSLSPRSAPGPASQIQALENTLKFLQLQELGKLYSLRARPR